MSVRFLALVRNIDKARAGLSLASTCVLWALADHADAQGLSYAGQDRLGRETCMGARHVRRCLVELLRLGLLEWSRASRTEPNRYRLRAEALASLPMASSGPGEPVASGPGEPVDERTPRAARSDEATGSPEPVRPDNCDTSTGSPEPDKRHRSVSRSVRERETPPPRASARGTRRAAVMALAQGAGDRMPELIEAGHVVAPASVVFCASVPEAKARHTQPQHEVRPAEDESARREDRPGEDDRCVA